MNDFYQDDFLDQTNADGTVSCWQLALSSDVDKSCDYPPLKTETSVANYIGASRDEFYDDTFINAYTYDANGILQDNGEFQNPPRKAANVRERKRMYSINHAFEVQIIISGH